MSGSIEDLRERVRQLEAEARAYEADAECRPRQWNGHYVKSHYVLTEPSGRRFLCWPNAGFMNSSDGSERRWAPCADCIVQRVGIDDALDLLKSLERKTP